MNAFQTMVIIALFAILGALFAGNTHAIPDKACYGPMGKIVVVKASRMCPVGYTE